MITQQIKLNLIPGQVFPRVNASQYDSGTRTLQMALYNGDQVFNIASGMTAVVQGTKPDRTGFQYAATVTAGSNIVTIDITQQMTAVKGEVVCELVLANDDDRIATVNFILYVEAAALADDTVISETDLPLIEEAAELAERIDGIVQQIDEDAQTASNAADKAEAYGTHPPYIGANGNWFVYNVTTQQYEDSGVEAQGPLSGLTDVALSTLADSQSLIYDGTSQKWVNGSVAYSSLSGKPTFGTAAAKNSTNAVTSGSTDLVESGAVASELATVNSSIQTLKNELDTTYLLAEQKTHSFAVSGTTNAEILQNLAQHILAFIQGLNDGVAIELLNLTIRGTGTTLIIPQKILLTNTITDLSFNVFAMAGGSGTTYLYTGTVWASTLSANKLTVCTLQDNQAPASTNYDFTNATSFNFEMKHWKVVDLS